MSEVLHGDPVDIHEANGGHESARYQTAVVLIVFDPVEQFVASVGHEQFADDE